MTRPLPGEVPIDLPEDGWIRDPALPGLYWTRRVEPEGPQPAAFCLLLPTGGNARLWAWTPNLPTTDPRWFNYWVDGEQEFLPYTEQAGEFVTHFILVNETEGPDLPPVPQ